MRNSSVVPFLIALWVLGVVLSLGVTGMVIYALYLGIKFLQGVA